VLPILYSFRRCPFAVRARWALLEAGLSVHWREIELKHKPAEMLQCSAKGTVPVLVLTDGTVIDESEAVMRWALAQADPRGLLQAGEASALIAENDGAFKHHLDRFKYTDRYPGESRDKHRDAGLRILAGWGQRLKEHTWLLGKAISLADAALWPFVRQWRLADPEGFEADGQLEPLREWLNRFLDDPSFERLMQRADPWSSGGLQPMFPADATAVPLDQPLFHLALKRDWEQALETGTYQWSTRGMRLVEVGFIHCSWQEQVAKTFERFYADAEDVLLLEIDPTRLSAPLRADAIPTGELFPHLYGPLPIEAVRTFTPYGSDS
jgi:glutathione S-transferase